jgi:hypothetical protein
MEGGCGCTGGCEFCRQKVGGCDQNSEMMGKILGAAIIILILMVLWLFVFRPVPEKYVGKSLSEMEIYTSGATLRRLGQVFSSTNQGVQTTIYNADVNGKETPMNVIITPV